MRSQRRIGRSARRTKIDELETNADDEWTPARGLRRAIPRTLLAAVVASALLWPLAAYFPMLVLSAALRAFLALIVTWCLFAVAQRAAGFCGGWVTVIAIAGTVLVLLSNHAAFALHGVPTRGGTVTGAVWFHPWILLISNITALIGIGAATIICHRAGATLEPLLEILTRRVR